MSKPFRLAIVVVGVAQLSLWRAHAVAQTGCRVPPTAAGSTCCSRSRSWYLLIRPAASSIRRRPPLDSAKIASMRVRQTLLWCASAPKPCEMTRQPGHPKVSPCSSKSLRPNFVRLGTSICGPRRGSGSLGFFGVARTGARIPMRASVPCGPWGCNTVILSNSRRARFHRSASGRRRMVRVRTTPLRVRTNDSALFGETPK